MFKYISLLFIFISFTACTEKNNIEKIFNNAVSENFSGSILVASEGEIIFTGANGKRDFENDIPLMSSDIFELASISKQFTAMMVMICKEKGLLDYDDLVKSIWISLIREFQLEIFLHIQADYPTIRL